MATVTFNTATHDADLAAAGSSADRARANHTGTQAISTVTGLATALDVGPACIRENPVGTYATRDAATSNAARVVIWIGPTAPPIGGGYAINDVDVWFRTP